MTTIQLLCVVLSVLSAPAWAGTARDPVDTTAVDAADATVRVDTAGAMRSPEPTVAIPPSSDAVGSAIADAFRKADQPACSNDNEGGLGCTIAETALGSALFDEREWDRANQTFLQDR